MDMKTLLKLSSREGLREMALSFIERGSSISKNK
jgi:hypothetical protein